MYYYFLASILPKLQVGTPPDLSFYELINLLQDNLTKDDYDHVRVMRRFYDIQNARALWEGRELDKWGNLDIIELDEAMLTRVGFTQFAYVYDFLQRYEKIEERLAHFPLLVVGYFYDEIPRAEGFLREYLIFERQWRLVLTAFRSKVLNRDLLKELQYEDPDDPLIAQILAQKDAPHYEPPAQYSDLKPLFEKYRDQPFDLYQALCEYRFEKISELVGIDLFSIDRILAYMAQFIIVDKWLELDKRKGIEIVETIVEESA